MDYVFLMTEGWVLVPKQNCSIPFIVCICFVAVTDSVIDVVVVVVVFSFVFLVVASSTTFLMPKPKPLLSACSLPGSSGEQRAADCIVEATLAFGGRWLF
jgi:hypothetical protein